MWIEERDGKFKYSERYKDYLTGKQKKVSVTLEKKNDKAAFALLMEKIEKARSESDFSKMTFGELVDKYLAFRKENLKDSTYIKTVRTTKAFIEMLGADTKLNKLNSAIIRTAVEKHDKDNGTRNERLTRLKALLRWGYENEYIEDVAYLSRLKLYPDTKKKVKLQEKFLEADEIRTLIGHIEDNTCMNWVYLSKFLLLSGLRIGEAMALEYGDISDMYINVNKTFSLSTESVHDTPKTDRSNREVYTQKELAEVIRAIKQYNSSRKITSKYLFHDDEGEIIGYGGYLKWLKLQSTAAIGRAITPHVFRHTHCSVMIAQGESLDAVARRLGHVDSRITKAIYLHYTEQIKENDRRRMDNIRFL